MTLNKVQLIGAVAKEPELRTTQSGKATARLRVITTETWSDRQTGEVKESQASHLLAVWGRDAVERCAHLSAGERVYVEGKLKTRSYEAQGVKKFVTEVIVDFGGTIQSLDGHSQQGLDDAPQQDFRRQDPDEIPF